jgi:hypothetical protein
MDAGLFGLGAVTLPDGTLYVMGGQPAGYLSGTTGSTGGNPLVNAEYYVPSNPTQGWTALPPMPTARYDVAVATDQDGGRIFVFGGQPIGPPGNGSATIEAWDTQLQKWIQ